MKLEQFQEAVWGVNERSAAGDNPERGDGAQAGPPVLQGSTRRDPS